MHLLCGFFPRGRRQAMICPGELLLGGKWRVDLVPGCPKQPAKPGMELQPAWNNRGVLFLSRLSAFFVFWCGFCITDRPPQTSQGVAPTSVTECLVPRPRAQYQRWLARLVDWCGVTSKTRPAEHLPTSVRRRPTLPVVGLQRPFPSGEQPQRHWERLADVLPPDQ